MWLGSDNERIVNGGAAALQSVVIAFTYSNLWKAVTNRQHPTEGVAASNEDSKNFRFGFLKQGTFNGWPSGHMMTNTALSTTLITYFHDQAWVKLAAYSWMTYIMASVVLGNSGGVHWASDAVAGGFMGFTVGYTVGKSFLEKNNPTNIAKKSSDSMKIFPLVNRNNVQIMLMKPF